MEQITMSISQCCEAFRANHERMNHQKFWEIVETGEFEGWVFPRNDTKKRTAVIYISGFIDYMHKHGVKYVLPYEADKKAKENHHEA